MFSPTTKGLGIACGALALSCLALGWLLKGALEDVGRLEERIAEKNRQLTEAADANASNLTTIGELEAAIDGWAAVCSLAPGAAEEAVAETRADAARTETETRALERERKADYESDTDYQQWADQLAPDPVADRLRRAARSADRDAHRDRGGEGAGTGAGEGGADGAGADPEDPAGGGADP